MLFFLPRATASSPTTGAVTGVRPRSATATTWTITPTIWRASSSTSTCTTRSTSGIRPGWRSGALPGPPRRKPRGQGRVDQRGAAADGEDRRQPRGPAQGACSTTYRRSWPPTGRSSIATCRRDRSTASTAPASKSSEAIIENWWRQGMMGGAKAGYDGIVAFSQTDFTEDLKKITIPVLVMHSEDDQIVPYVAAGPKSAELLQERNPQDLPRISRTGCRPPRRTPSTPTCWSSSAPSDPWSLAILGR